MRARRSPLASSTLRPNWPLAHLPAPGCLERLRDQCRSLSSALEYGNERWSRRLCAYERLLTSLNGNLLFARAARTFCGEKGSIPSERDWPRARLSTSLERASGATCRGPSPPSVLTLAVELGCLGRRGGGGLLERQANLRTDEAQSRPAPLLSARGTTATVGRASRRSRPRHRSFERASGSRS